MPICCFQLAVMSAVGGAECTQAYGVYPLILQSALSINTSKSTLILSAANQLFQETVYKRNYWTTSKGFFFSCVDGLRNKD